MDKNEKEKLFKEYKTFRRIFYSRLILIVFLLLLQIAFFILVAIRLESYIQYFLSGNLLLNAIFLIYLVNSKNRNEFKILWMLPVLILPVFGILFYVYLKWNKGGILVKNHLDEIKKEFTPYLSNLQEEKNALSEFPKVRDISVFLNYKEKFPPYINTQTKYYPSGESCFVDMKEALKTAQKFIFIEFFIIQPGKMFSEIMEILLEKAKKGVQIKALFDGFGSLSVATKWNLKYLKNHGIDAEIFKPFAPILDTAQNTRDHRKNFIIDGKVCFTGGINITDEYVNITHARFNYWKDSMIRIEGPAVRSFIAMFLELFYLQRNSKTKTNDFKSYLEVDYPMLETDGVVIPYGDDAYNDEDISENVYKYIISKSHDYVHIISPYLVIDNSFIESMIFAVKRGVEVALIVPKNYDHFLTYCIGRLNIKTLIQNGIKVYQYMPGFIHSKVFVSDGNRATCGSVNLDYRSFYHHFEDGAFLYKSETINDIERDFQITKASCQEITMKVYDEIPKRYKILGWFLKIVSPLL